MPPSPAAAQAISNVWRTEGRILRDPRGNPVAVHDPARPKEGVRVAFASSDGLLLGFEPPADARLVDHWLRDGDATSVWEASGGDRLRTTAMWRLCGSEPGVLGWEIVISSQTAILSADARLAVTSRLPVGAAATVSFGGFAAERVSWSRVPAPRSTAVLVTPAAGDPTASSAVLVVGHPREADGTIVHRDAATLVVETRLFLDGLEKGVLLRGRVLAAIGPAVTAADWASRLADAFAAAPPVLST